jgi:integrase/recombinase XerD
MLTQAINRYLQLRRAGGFQLRYTEVLLREFARFAAERGEPHIKADTAIAWAARATSLKQRARRLNSLILFARYIRAEDAAHEVPPNGVFAHQPRSRPRPHIYTPTEIGAILAEAKQLPPAGSLRPLTFYTLFGLVAACGLRISEALALEAITSVLTDSTSATRSFEKVGWCHSIRRRQPNWPSTLIVDNN